MRFQGAALLAVAASHSLRQAAGQVYSAVEVAAPLYPPMDYGHPEAVDCGGHFAGTCAGCPHDNGELWCNGECIWVLGGCEDATLWHRVMWLLLNWRAHWYSFLPAVGVTALIMFVFAVMYKLKVVNNLPQDRIKERPADSQGWKEQKLGLFACFTDIHTLLYTTFCLPVVAAKNYDAGNVCGFWPSCIVMFVGLYSPFYCITVLIRTAMSGRLKRNMGYEQSVCKSCFTNFFCFPCEVGRESMEVDDELGVEIKCLNKVETTWLGPSHATAATWEGRVCVT